MQQGYVVFSMSSVARSVPLTGIRQCHGICIPLHGWGFLLLFLLYVRETSYPIYKVQSCKDTSTSLRDGASKRCSWQDMWYSQVPLTDRHHLSIMALFSVDLTRWWLRQFYQSVRLTPRGNLLTITRGSVSENWGGGGGLLGFSIQGQGGSQGPGPVLVSKFMGQGSWLSWESIRAAVLRGCLRSKINK